MKIGFSFSIARASGNTITIEQIDEDLSYDKLVDLFEEFSIEAGYAIETIDQYLTRPTVKEGKC